MASRKTLTPIPRPATRSTPHPLAMQKKSTGGCTDDTWTPTSVINVPLARIEHTAIWTGSEMIVWGGIDDSLYLNTGGRYNPATDSWMTTSTADAPTPRIAHTAVWTGSEMVVWGGHDGTLANTGARYNPAADGWIPTSTINAPLVELPRPQYGRVAK